jgi:type II secretory pathway pseudopilin PulG
MIKTHNKAFSLVEVVLAIGVISFAIVAILGMFPVSSQTSHISQGETRATHIAEDVFAAISTQARTAASPASLNSAAAVKQASTSAIPTASATPTVLSQNIDLTASHTYSLAADNDGNLTASYTAGLPYKVTVTTTPNPTPFNSNYACQVTVRIAWEPFSQNYRDFVRVVSKY